VLIETRGLKLLRLNSETTLNEATSANEDLLLYKSVINPWEYIFKSLSTIKPIAFLYFD
jgi:hypothetical protein